MDIKETIERAVAVVGSQKALAELIGEAPAHISGFKNGRPCGYQKHARIAAIAGLEDRAIRILIEGIANSLDEKVAHEGKAKLALLAVLNAFPEEKTTIARARGVAADKPRLRKSLRT